MRVVFFSNFLLHHQLPFCLEMRRHFGDDFFFIATENVGTERLAFGYKDMNHSYPFVLNAHESKENEEKTYALAKDSDVVIFGAAPEKYLQYRMKHKGLTFRYCERPLKKGRKQLLNLHMLNTMLHLHTKYALTNLYMLCASAYTAGDCALVGAYWGKAFKWGYFPDIEEYNIEELLKKKERTSILWAGRLLGWKHPDEPILVAQKLKETGIPFNMNLIGNGEMERQLQNMIHERHLEDEVHLLGSMPPEKVREYMERSEIYLFTSDQNEGWGAVLNESMNSGCAVITNRSIGSVPFLVKDGYNGMLYQSGNVEDLFKKVRFCLQQPDVARNIGRNAYVSIYKEWNATEATDRFISLANGLLKKQAVHYKDGPCSRARWI